MAALLPEPKPKRTKPTPKPQDPESEVVLTQASPEILDWLGLPSSGLPGDSPTKKPRTRGGNLPSVTPETLKYVARRRVFGLTLTDALALEPEPITVAWFQAQLQKRPRFARLYSQSIALAKLPVLAFMEKCSLRTMPSNVWKLERIFPEDYAPPSARNTGAITINNNTVIAVQDQVMGRVASLVRKGIATDKAGILRPDKASGKLPAAAKAELSQAIDVESSTVS